MSQLIHKVGGNNVVTNTDAVFFADGTEQFTAASTQANTLQAGVAVSTSNSVSVTFAKAYVGANAPLVVITGIDGWDTKGLIASVSLVGSAHNWTGFTVNISGQFFGAFNWIAIGNPD